MDSSLCGATKPVKLSKSIEPGSVDYWTIKLQQVQRNHIFRRMRSAPNFEPTTPSRKAPCNWRCDDTYLMGALKYHGLK